MVALAERENIPEDDSFPEPSELPFDVGDIDFLYSMWSVWVALDKRFMPSQIANEFLSGNGKLLTGVMNFEGLFQKAKMQVKKRTPTNG